MTQVTSKHYIDKLESSIIQIARALSIEFGVKVDPDSKKMTREIIQRKVNQLLSDEERSGIKQLWDDTVANLSTGNVTQYVRNVYEALKTAGYDDV